MLQPQPSSRLKIQLLLSLGIVTLLLLGVFFLAQKKPIHKTANVTVFSQPRKIQAFALGSPLFSEKNLVHHWTLLFFGFTHCPDICPTTLTELKEAYSYLHPQYPELQVVFVSVDPEGDHPAELKRYTASFNKDFIGLVGTSNQVEKLEQQLGVVSHQDKGSAMLSHTSSVFLINPKGQWVALFPYGLRSQEIQAHFKTIVESTAHV